MVALVQLVILKRFVWVVEAKRWKNLNKNVYQELNDRIDKAEDLFIRQIEKGDFANAKKTAVVIDNLSNLKDRYLDIKNFKR